MGARVYDPYTGTFTQPDPIQRADASNYGYADGDPVNETDLDGQSVVGDICIRTGNCTDNHGSPEPKNPTLGDIVQVITLVTLPTVLLDPMEGGAEAAAAHAAEDAGGDAGRLVIGRTADRESTRCWTSSPISATPRRTGNRTQRHCVETCAMVLPR
jgi:hypothetical protein